MPIPSDTPIEVADLQLAFLAQKSPKDRLILAAQLADEVFYASRKAIVRVHPGLTSEEIDDLFIELHYGCELANAVRAYRKMRACKLNHD
ncbi:MAG: hypothetical protein SFV81_11535 [Pirellulaceae bacterium]|nr:hypothetical protein [Pirellulaceae bacterium]